MPKNSTGAYTTGEAKRIEIDYLFKNGFIEKDRVINRALYWTDANGDSCGNISIMSVFKDEEKYIQLNYTLTERNGDKIDRNYKIAIEGIKSNLGKGYNYYFLCPVSDRRCKILYMAYGSHYFKARESYQNRIYYDCQIVSKQYYPMQRYFTLEKRLEKLCGKKYRETYKGRTTRSLKRIDKVEQELYYWDRNRMGGFVQTMERMLLKKNR